MRRYTKQVTNLFSKQNTILKGNVIIFRAYKKRIVTFNISLSFNIDILGILNVRIEKIFLALFLDI